jgi:hypothetical protein
LRPLQQQQRAAEVGDGVAQLGVLDAVQGLFELRGFLFAFACGSPEFAMQVMTVQPLSVYPDWLLQTKALCWEYTMYVTTAV